MTPRAQASNRLFDIKFSVMMMSLLLAYATAALSAGAGWGQVFSEMLSSMNDTDNTAMELEPSARFAHGLEP